MRFYIALVAFFLCHAGASIYASKLKEVKRLGSVRHYKYNASDSYYYSVYSTTFGRGCYLNNEIYVNCEEL